MSDEHQRVKDSYELYSVLSGALHEFFAEKKEPPLTAVVVSAVTAFCSQVIYTASESSKLDVNEVAKEFFEGVRKGLKLRKIEDKEA